jgi:hypothetical protein
VDFKYNRCEPNILCSSERNSSPFWKGVKWAAQAAKLGYCWKVGNGRKVRFWEDSGLVAAPWLYNFERFTLL